MNLDPAALSTHGRSRGRAARPVAWSISGNDSGGGAGLSADQRAFDAFDVHMCPVVAAVTAQNSLGVSKVDAVGADQLDAQLAALEHDMLPTVVKTGLLASLAQVQVVARWIDRLREAGRVALVVDPVFKSTTGSSFANEDLIRAYARLLVPRATVITPNRSEATALLGVIDSDERGHANGDASGLPGIARALRRRGAAAVCITGGDAHDVLAMDWSSSEHAEGWLVLPRVDTPHHHGTGCTFASSLAAALARGFVPADAVILAKMSTSHALRHAYEAGHGAGPVHATGGFGNDPSLLPIMSWSTTPVPDSAFLPTCERQERQRCHPGLYGIVSEVSRLQHALAHGIQTVQMRIKRPPSPDAAWHHHLRVQLNEAARLCSERGARLFINDHWQIALELHAHDPMIGLHQGQEDWLALVEADRERIVQSGIPLGISSHSLWELCRARSLNLAYIACGPVWPTSTKAMPWRAQGLHNLAWWQAMAGSPVAAIGGVLSPVEVEAAASTGAALVCVVRALDVVQGECECKCGETMSTLQRAFERGHSRHPHSHPWASQEKDGSTTAGRAPAFPLPSL